jgi:putative protease
MKKKKTAPKAKAQKKSAPKKAAAKKVKKAKAIVKKKKTAKRKAQKKKSPPRPTVIAPMNSTLLGYVEDYFAKVGVVALKLQHKVAVGDRLHLLGHTTQFEQTVDSLQIDHESVVTAGPKAEVGIKVTARARRGDHVYLIR